MKAENYLYEIEPQGRKAQVSYRDEVRGASMIRAAVHMEEGKTGMRTGHRGAYKWGPNRE